MSDERKELVGAPPRRSPEAGSIDAPERQAADGLCFFCGKVDAFVSLRRIAGSWLAHPDCEARAANERAWSQR